MFLDLDPDTYMWIKAMHIIGMVAWMAGQFYLPRLFVYHSVEPAGSPTSETFKVMERRLVKAIMNPAMAWTATFGAILLAAMPESNWSSAWLYVKLACVAGLFAMHVLGMRWRADFAIDRNRHSQRFYRIANEVPTLLMIVLVCFAVVKPF